MQRKVGILVWLVIVSLCLWSSAAAARTTYAADQGLAITAILSGGDYRLTTVTWPASPVAQGERYVVLARDVRPAESTLSGNGCCCIYLPCIRR